MGPIIVQRASTQTAQLSRVAARSKANSNHDILKHR
jgi:hypothetical protein